MNVNTPGENVNGIMKCKLVNYSGRLRMSKTMSLNSSHLKGMLNWLNKPWEYGDEYNSHHP